MSTTNTDKYPPIALDGLEAKRLTFKHGEFTYVYDARGYQFARCPTTGDSRTEPKENMLSRCDTGIFFGAYDDGWPHYFAFYEADCFDPPQYLICARSFEDAYDIFLEEFGTKVDTTDTDFNTEEKREEAMDNGQITYTGGGALVHCESVNGHELKLVKIELVEER